jgi:hypothetical protein
MNASYTKLRSGDWGLKIIDDDVEAGDTVPVRKRDGSINYETIDRIIYENSSYFICTIKKPDEAGNYSELAYREARDDVRPANPIRWSEEYQIYADNAESMGLPVKSFEEWR